MNRKILTTYLLGAMPLGSAFLDPVQLVEVPDIEERAAVSAVITTTSTIGGTIVQAFPSGTLGPAVAAAASPTGTPSIVVKADSSTFNIGDADANIFIPLWESVCDENGCTGGTKPNFLFNTVDKASGENNLVSHTGTFTMTGIVGGNNDTTQTLLGAIFTAMIKSNQCSTTQGANCPVKRDSGGSKQECGTPFTVGQCSLSNFIEATLFDGNGAVDATITMQASSDTSGSFDCGTVFGIASGAATTFDFDPLVQGGVNIAQLICTDLTGGS